MKSVQPIIYFLLALIGCSTPHVNVEQEWTLIGRSKQEVEEAFDKGNYFRSDRKVWAPRGSSRVMDNIIPLFDSTNTLVAIWRTRISTKVTDAPAIFQGLITERKQVLGEPSLDTLISELDAEEHRLMWKLEASEKPIFVRVSLLHSAGIIQTSYLESAEKVLLKSFN
jgi:hypothetical protein